jgi:hypothetical protein
MHLTNSLPGNLLLYIFIKENLNVGEQVWVGSFITSLS